jgi:hypothetical protein
MPDMDWLWFFLADALFWLGIIAYRRWRRAKKEPGRD